MFDPERLLLTLGVFPFCSVALPPFAVTFVAELLSSALSVSEPSLSTACSLSSDFGFTKERSKPGSD